MQSLPLFPLHVVLFPKMPLPLHIFEDRYKEMIRLCLSEGRDFGVLLINEGEDTLEKGPKVIPHRVGTIARIRAINPDESREEIDILVEGVRRFKLLESFTGEDAYLIGNVEMLNDDPFDSPEIPRLMDKIESLFRQYFEILLAQTGMDLPEFNLPRDPEELSFVIAAVLDSDNEFRQSLLEMTDTHCRLAIESERLEAELSQIKTAPPQVLYEQTMIDAERRKDFHSRN